MKFYKISEVIITEIIVLSTNNTEIMRHPFVEKVTATSSSYIIQKLAQKPNVKSVFAFELVKHTADFARKILELKQAV